MVSLAVMELNITSIQTTLLWLLANSRTDARIGSGRHYLAEELRAQFSPHQQPSVQQTLAAMWAPVSQGLAYIDLTNCSPDNWELCLTEIGLAAARDEEINPDNAGEYLRRLETKVPDASPTVVQYAREAIVSYTSKSYLASAVMLGVASEAAFLETANTFGSWLDDGPGEKFLEIINNPKTNYIAKFAEFRKE